MAEIEAAPPKSESERLYAAWRCAAARWELALYDPSNLGEDLEDEAETRHLDETHGAFVAYMLHPACDLMELSRKLRVFHQEDGRGLTDAPRILEALAKDAGALAFEDACRDARMKANAA
ncbi:MAG: hypothetical protein RIS94_1871 [Pseudomonadota bacterium]|jgi:hypothetical protein